MSESHEGQVPQDSVWLRRVLFLIIVACIVGLILSGRANVQKIEAVPTTLEAR